MAGSILPALGILAGGCAMPGDWGRGHVAGEIDARIGQLLGPKSRPFEVVIPDFVEFADGLAEDEAVALGLWNNPEFQELLADLEISRADVVQAHELPNPRITTAFPVGVKEWEFALALPLDVLWLRPHRLAAAQIESQRVAERLVQDGLNTVRDVRVAYADVVLAQRGLELAEEGSRLRTRIAQIAEARLRSGALAELDVSAIRLEALAGKQEIVRARRDLEMARERLLYLLGAAMSDLEWTAAGLPDVPPVELDGKELVAEAVASRPDLAALRLAIEAASRRLRLTRSDYFDLSGILPDINADGKKGFEAGPGLEVTLPILNQNQGATVRASAQQERWCRQYVKLHDQVVLEVRAAWARLRRDQEALAIWRQESLPELQAALVSAERGLAEDGVALTLLLDTTRRLLDARRREIEAAADVHRALAELERSVGRRLFDPAARAGAGAKIGLAGASFAAGPVAWDARTRSHPDGEEAGTDGSRVGPVIPKDGTPGDSADSSGWRPCTRRQGLRPVKEDGPVRTKDGTP